MLPYNLDLQYPLIGSIWTPVTVPQSPRMVQIREAWIKRRKFLPNPKIAFAAMMSLHGFRPQYHQSLSTARPLCQGSSHLKVTQPLVTQETEHPETRHQNESPHSPFHSKPPWIPTDPQKPHVGGGSEGPWAQCRAQGVCLGKVKDWSSAA